MFPPWRKLKDAEMSMLARRKRRKPGSTAVWKRLRDLFEQCRQAEDAECAICFHGVAALLAEQDGDFQLAIEHRLIEIEKIIWIQEEETRNPTGGAQTKNYGIADLEFRRTLLREVEAKL